VKVVDSENILVVAMISTKSHKITYLPLLEELANRGHKITIVSPIKADKETKNIKEIFTIDMNEMMDKIDIYKMKEENQQMNPFMVSLLCRADESFSKFFI
jgi:glucuronosyltransferase